MSGYTYSATGTRTRVARVRAEYPNQLDYSGFECELEVLLNKVLNSFLHIINVIVYVVEAWHLHCCLGNPRLECSTTPFIQWGLPKVKLAQTHNLKH